MIRQVDRAIQEVMAAPSLTGVAPSFAEAAEVAIPAMMEETRPRDEEAEMMGIPI